MTIIILAAGNGTRMKSNTPKVMHEIASIPMIEYILKTAQELCDDDIRVVANKEVIKFLEIYNISARYNFEFIEQKEKLGTGHAVLCAIENINKELGDKIVILYGDTPLIKASTIKKIISKLDSSFGAKIVCLGFKSSSPSGYGRFITSSNKTLIDIVEEKEANQEELNIDLCNSGIMVIKNTIILELLKSLKNNNTKSEYYLTDIIKSANKKGIICMYDTTHETEVMGINNKVQLSYVENFMQQQIKIRHMMQGVTMISPETIWIAADAIIEEDVILHPNTIIGPGVKLSKGTVILPFCYLTGVEIAKNCSIGPFTHIRPQTKIGEGSRIGNFVEIKASDISDHVKASHLAYIGDAQIGKETNIGAGAIFCNYDGKNKHKTTVGDGVFIGSNSALIAPISIGDNAMIAAGSVITQKVEKDEIAIARSRQINKNKKNN